MTPNTLYIFADHVPTPESPALVIQIQSMKGTFDINERMKPAEVPTLKGIKVALEEFRWNGHTVDMLRYVTKTPDGGDMIAYTLQCPLAPKAVQLQVAGVVERDTELRKLFNQVAGSFVNLKPLATFGGAHLTLKPLSWPERIRMMVSGLTRMAVVATVLVIGGGALVKRMRGAKKTEASPAPPPLPPPSTPPQ